jgi:hypothetical protein
LVISIYYFILQACRSPDRDMSLQIQRDIDNKQKAMLMEKDKEIITMKSEKESEVKSVKNQFEIRNI